MDDLKKQIIKYHKYLGWPTNNYEMRHFYDSIARKIAAASGVILDGACAGCQLADSTIQVTTWYESCHNGDSYDIKKHIINQTSELLQIICVELSGVAFKKATEEYEQVLREEKNQKVRAFLATKLLHLNNNGH